MELTNNIVNAVVVAIATGVLGFFMNGRFQSLEDRMDRLEDRMERFDDRFDSVRSDLTAIALAVGAKPRVSRS